MSDNPIEPTREGISELGPPDEAYPNASASDRGQPPSIVPGSVQQGSEPRDSETLRDHQREGSRPRVPRPEEIDRLEEALAEAFSKGDPERAWFLSKEILTLAKAAVIESAKSRYSNNFGTPVCESCEGLKVGPGVTATCFQVRQCYYDSFRSETLSPKQARLLNLLG